MRSYTSAILNALIKISNNPEVDKKLKKTNLLIYSDALLYCSDETSNFLPQILQIYNNAITLVLELPTPNVSVLFIYFSG